MALGDKLPLLLLASFKLLLLMLSKRQALCNQMSALAERQDWRDLISCVFEPFTCSLTATTTAPECQEANFAMLGG